MIDQWSVSGLKELDDKLTELGAKVGTRVLRKAGREAMTGVALSMAMGAGFDPDNKGEHMRDAIKITGKKQDKKGGADNAVAIRVGPSKKHAQKAIAQEYGREGQAADPFMRPALAENRHKIVGTFRTVLATEILKAVSKMK
ncbi:hypothetical protein K6Y31_20730 [Motilimonas cestriensis]|uniref:Phage protein, HK97 gp10 family n=1 Tax=Motilimonas cestriensis TaxID=2742685 RepID=A0ABS8WFW6_9GAMM|nr:HK97-gp10 family putative phage morphogenesis protein [Motilimonas cestriensis]MCE2597203.1 hypothetical protein [Motilimonas cestriensis]